MNGGIAPPFLVTTLDRGEQSSLRPCRFAFRETAPGTYYIRGWMDPSAGLEATEETNPLVPARNRAPVLRSSGSWPRIYNTKEKKRATRMSSGRIPKTYSKTRTKRKRSLEGPMTQWMDSVA